MSASIIRELVAALIDPPSVDEVNALIERANAAAGGANRVGWISKALDLVNAVVLSASLPGYGPARLKSMVDAREELAAHLRTVPTEPAPVPATVRAALERMMKPLHESRLSGETAQEDARCMQIIAQYINGQAERPSPDARDAVVEAARKLFGNDDSWSRKVSALEDALRALDQQEKS